MIPFVLVRKNDYYSRGKRKQVWMTPKTLKLFRVALKLEWIVKTKAEIRPKYSTKRNGGMTSVYQRTPPFLKLLKNLSVKDLEPDKDLPWVILKDDDGNILDLPSGYLLSHSHRRTVSVLIKCNPPINPERSFVENSFNMKQRSFLCVRPDTVTARSSRS